MKTFKLGRTLLALASSFVPWLPAFGADTIPNLASYMDRVEVAIEAIPVPGQQLTYEVTKSWKGGLSVGQHVHFVGAPANVPYVFFGQAHPDLGAKTGLVVLQPVAGSVVSEPIFRRRATGCAVMTLLPDEESLGGFKSDGSAFLGPRKEMAVSDMHLEAIPEHLLAPDVRASINAALEMGSTTNVVDDSVCIRYSTLLAALTERAW